jgi:hypothetical protein
MKPKRVILIFDEELHLPSLRLVLVTRGYKVLSCVSDEEREAIMGRCWVDLLLVGPRVECRYEGDVPKVLRQPDWSMAELVERLRLPLLRKRGPKGVTSEALTKYQQEQVRKAARG